MTAQHTDRVLTCYRIGDPDGMFPIYDAEGSRLYPGRWNTQDSPVIYTSENYSAAMLEKLVHSNGMMPKNQHYIRITIPNGLSYETFNAARHPGWADEREDVCKIYGDGWYQQQRSAILIVPSLPARIERNIIINPTHPEAQKIHHTMHEPIWWDERLYG